MLDEEKIFNPKEIKNCGRVQHVEGKHIKEDAKQKTSNEVVEKNLKKNKNYTRSVP